MTESWQMNKLGFVNFWLYDWEEFPFSGGRLLLRGENGAGKSITTQSFVPFMLDGDLRPHRLDAFGSKDRKMQYYLLGDDKEENTGYLYLEFVKPETRLYRTLVVGMRAQRSKSSMDFWGFCLSDGRRIGDGENDFSLFAAKGRSQRVSLTKQEARNRFGGTENWVEKSSEYKQMVNRMLFGCEELSQYDRLLKLIIQIRKPKLSKDFSPELVCNILNESLQPLSEEDIAPMVHSMEKMDDIQTRLENLTRCRDEAGMLRTEYDKYNRFVLGKKGNLFLDAHGQTGRKQREVAGQEKELAQCVEKLQRARQDLTDAEQKIATIQRQLDALGGGEDLKQKAGRLQELRGQYDREQQGLEKSRQAEQKKQEQLQREQREQSRLKRETGDQQELLCQIFAELEELNGELHCPVHPGSISQVKQAAQNAELKAFKQKLEQAARLLREREEANETLGALQQALDAADSQLRHERAELERAEKEVRDQKNELMEAFAALEDPSLPFALTAQDVQALMPLVDTYEGTAQEQAISEILADRLTSLRKPLEKSLAVNEQKSAHLQQDLNDLRSRKQALEQQKEVPPPRSEAVQATRNCLREKDIPHASFYELVDFVQELDPPKRAMLESQLMDAGILDALVFPPERSREVQNLLTEHPDHFLCLTDTDTAREPLPLCAGQEAPGWAHIGTVLSALSAGTEGTVWFSADGRYRQGAIQGRSVPAGEARYIGASARRANRARLLAELESQMADKQREIEECSLQRKQLENSLTELGKAYDERPRTGEVAAALQLAAEQSQRMNEAQQKCIFAQDRCREQRNRVDMLRAKLQPLLREFPEQERTADHFEDLVWQCADYENKLRDVVLEAGKLELKTNLLERCEEHLEELNNDLLDKGEQIRRAEFEHRQTEAAIQSLKEFLERPENLELARTIETLAEQRKTAEGDRETAKQKMLTEQVRQQQMQPALETARKALAEQIGREERLRQIFEEELCHGPGQPGREDMPLTAQAQAAWEAVPESERGMTHESLRTSLDKKLKQTSALNDYRVTLGTLFPSEEGMVRNRACIDLYTDGKRQDLLPFMETINAQIRMDEQLLSRQDRELFEHVLSQTITAKLRHRIDDSAAWVRQMSSTMQSLSTSMGLRFGLEWKERPADSPQELGTRELVQLLRTDEAVMTEENRQRMAEHFRARIHTVRTLSRQEEGRQATYSELMRQVLDFRSWFAFQLYFQKEGAPRKPLTASAFNSFSGGEKAMAMYVPLFAALKAQYGAADPTAPKIMALDEAFAGVDEINIESMFRLVHELGLGYIMNSQSLWGCYPSVDALSIVELWRPQNAEVVTLLRYHWNGRVRTLEEG